MGTQHEEELTPESLEAWRREVERLSAAMERGMSLHYGREEAADPKAGG